MTNINKYQVNDFVQDLNFRKWVLEKSDADNVFWINWLNENPEKKGIIEEAKSLVVALQVEEIRLQNHQIQQGIQEILSKTSAKSQFSISKIWIRIAASVLIFLSAGWYVFNQFDFTNSFKKTAFSPMTETENSSIQQLNMTLSDGTIVRLSKTSKLQVALDFGQQTRTVFLTGEAFFDVKKDAQHPFLVIAGGIVTKVLGTSFNIRAYPNEATTSVGVRTGHVTVYKDEKINDKDKLHPDQFLLTPNQQAIFEKTEGKLVKTLVKNPIMLSNDNPTNKDVYFEKPISQVFAQLEQRYGVKIIYEKEQLNHCNLTATFSNEPLYEKIEIICETIQAHYEIADGQIVIYAKGCK